MYTYTGWVCFWGMRGEGEVPSVDQQNTQILCLTYSINSRLPVYYALCNIIMSRFMLIMWEIFCLEVLIIESHYYQSHINIIYSSSFLVVCSCNS